MQKYQLLINHCKQYLSNLQLNRQASLFDICIFFRQFSTLISAGIPIIKSCDILEKSQSKIALRILIYTIKHDILAGKPLSVSLKKYPQYFDMLTCHLIQIGEHTGKLDMMLISVANYWEKNLVLKKRIKQALFYPGIIISIALIITLAMLIFIIPRFAELFQDTEIKLPILTRCIFYLSSKVQQFIYFLLGITPIVYFILSHQKVSYQFIYSYLYKLPFIKSCRYKITLTRFARNLAITFTAGIPIIEGLQLAVDTRENTEFATLITKLRHRISSGRQLHQAMETFPAFPVLMVQMIKIGEETGMLEQMLNKMADFLESDIEQLIAYLSHILEPLIMIVLGVLIGGLVIAM